MQTIIVFIHEKRRKKQLDQQYIDSTGNMLMSDKWSHAIFLPIDNFDTIRRTACREIKTGRQKKREGERKKRYNACHA